MLPVLIKIGKNPLSMAVRRKLSLKENLTERGLLSLMLFM